MTIEEIFNKLASHMCEGVRFHDEAAKAYDYLNFEGLYKCHIYHATEEKHGFLLLSHYYMTHYFKLLQLENIPDSKLIPDTWYKYTTMAVDVGTKRNSIKDLMNKWVEWKRSTKKLYQEMRQELDALNELAAAQFIDTLIADVSKELRHAERKLLMLDTIGYDIVEIAQEQEELYHKYKKKSGW